MPYIPKERRERLPNAFFYDLPDLPTPGDLNFLFSSIGHEYLIRKEVTYSHINDIIGALQCTQYEMYRRIAIPYEIDAIKRNGDLWCPYE